MGVFKGIKNFLFGKDAEIFDDKGRVRHKLPDEKWKNWNNRFQENPTFNWRRHTGTQTDNKAKRH